MKFLLYNMFSPLRIKILAFTPNADLLTQSMNHLKLPSVQFWVLQECHKLWPDKSVFELCEKSRLNMFDKVCDIDKVRMEFTHIGLLFSLLWYCEFKITTLAQLAFHF